LPKVAKQKRNEDEIKRPLIVPECETNDPDEVWHPPDWFLEQIHDIMINKEKDEQKIIRFIDL
jgi:hypothetical protein